jgi:uncharacterized damage-inducible protein DinB
MAKQHRLTPLEEALEAWRDARGGLIREAENIPASLYAFRPTPEVRSIEDLLRHVLEVALMMVGELSRPDTDFRRAAWPDLLALYDAPLRRARGKPRVVALLRTQLAAGQRAFRRAGEREMRRAVTRFDGLKGTKLEWLHHGIAHEEYHRGQLALTARLLGREPALSRAIRTGKWD